MCPVLWVVVRSRFGKPVTRREQFAHFPCIFRACSQFFFLVFSLFFSLCFFLVFSLFFLVFSFFRRGLKKTLSSACGWHRIVKGTSEHVLAQDKPSTFPPGVEGSGPLLAVMIQPRQILRPLTSVTGHLVLPAPITLLCSPSFDLPPVLSLSSCRIEKKAPLNKPDHTTFFGGTAKGFTDYPFMEA